MAAESTLIGIWLQCYLPPLCNSSLLHASWGPFKVTSRDKNSLRAPVIVRELPATEEPADFGWGQRIRSQPPPTSLLHPFMDSCLTHLGTHHLLCAQSWAAWKNKTRRGPSLPPLTVLLARLTAVKQGHQGSKWRAQGPAWLCVAFSSQP